MVQAKVRSLQLPMLADLACAGYMRSLHCIPGKTKQVGECSQAVGCQPSEMGPFFARWPPGFADFLVGPILDGIGMGYMATHYSA